MIRTLNVATVLLTLSLTGVFSPVLAADPPAFRSPEEAVKALIDAARGADGSGLLGVFGADGEDIASSGDAVQDANDRAAFVEMAQRKTDLERDGDSRVTLLLGDDAWPFPVPLVRRADGWIFDVAQGREEILDRRIGRNELSTLRVLDAYVQAQQEYASRDRDGDGVPEYAQRLASEPGQQDGLYWPVESGEPPSPLGPLVADARAEGYRRGESGAPVPYHGYYYRILTAQGKDVPGGAYSYVINGNMIAGFAMLAFPAEYGASGVMSFIVNHVGAVYQKDLGPETAKLAEGFRTYDTGAGWTLVDRGP